MTVDPKALLRRIARPIGLSGLVLLLVVSFGLNIALARRSLYWRERAQERATGQRLRSATPIEETVVPVLKGKHLDGSEAVVEFKRSGPPTLLYLMSPSCGWCARNFANFKALVEQTKTRYRVVALSTTDAKLREYASDKGLTALGVELVVNVPQDVLDAENLRGTPQTLLVSPDGKLVKRWQGAYTQTQREIEITLGVHLPGLTD
jgi:hypothetical protein